MRKWNSIFIIILLVCSTFPSNIYAETEDNSYKLESDKEGLDGTEIINQDQEQLEVEEERHIETEPEDSKNSTVNDDSIIEGKPKGSTDTSVDDIETEEGKMEDSGSPTPNEDKTDVADDDENDLTIGMNADEVIQLKLNLDKIGFHVSNNPNDYFGAKTESAVKQLQEYYGLEVSGIVTDETMAMIEVILLSPFQNGINHEETIQLKEDLSRLGFHVSNNPTTYYGSSTEKHVRAFQSKYNLLENGIADSRTRAKIEELLAAPLANPLYREDVIDLKLDLAKVGFHVSANPTDYFGPTTERVVKEFQSYYGINNNGIAGEETLARIQEVLHSPFQNGKNHEDTIQLKLDLSKLGFHVSDTPTTYYGSSTEKKVEAFQNKYNLAANGIADSRTRAKIEELLAAPLANPLYREDVIDLKLDLEKSGFKVSNNPTDYFGPSTERVVKEFQSYYGLKINGIAGEDTLARIQEVLNSPFQNGKNHEDTIQLKLDLSKLGFHVSDTPTTYYGSSTEKKVEAFQNKYNLAANGIADSRTRAKIEELLAAPLANPLYREDVIDLKLDLEKAGFKVSNNPTDYFGPSTERVVKEFQSYYGLKNNGIAGEKTLAKLEEVVNSPFQDGKNHDDTIQLKLDLSKVGFHVSNDPTNYYGSTTEKKVREFQSYYGLRSSGIADEKTFQKLEHILKTSFQNGRTDEKIISIKQDLSKLGFHVSDTPTGYFGPTTEKRVKEFQKYFGLVENGILDEVTLAAIERNVTSIFQNGSYHKDVIALKKDLERTGFKVSDNPTDHYGPQTEAKVKEFQRFYKLVENGIADEVTLKKLEDVVSGRVARNVPSVVNGKQIYSYHEMRNDINRLADLYPGLIQTKVIGHSVDGRNIYAIKLGFGEKEIFFNGSHHAREHMTTNVLMKMVDDYAQAYAANKYYGTYNVRNILNNVSIWFVPMVNPDGVMLVQEGAYSAKNPAQVLRLNNYNYDFSSWKANIRGVDLNRQYPADWANIRGNTGRPTPSHYKGTKPLTEPEVIAITNFTNQHNFKTAVAYHSSGEIIYWYFNNPSSTYYRDRQIATKVGNITGYSLVTPTVNPSGGGYTDWFIQAKKLPGLTVEISPYTYSKPVPLNNWDKIWQQNKAVGLYLAEEAMRR